MKISDIETFILRPTEEEPHIDNTPSASLEISNLERDMLRELVEVRWKTTLRELHSDKVKPATKRRLRRDKEILSSIREKLRYL